MKKTWLCLALASVLTLSAALLGACDPKEPADNGGSGNGGSGNGGSGGGNGGGNGGGTVQTQHYVMPEDSGNAAVWENNNIITEVSVHDPSVFYDEASSTYYAFGSHFAVASSPDLITWTQEVRDNDSAKLYGTDWQGVLTNSVAATKTTMPSTWAPDVVKHGDTYYMYYSLTAAFGSSASVIGRVSSGKVLGNLDGDPYGNEKILLSSVSTGGVGVNCIDPELFYDKDGGLWMVYGSFFGGVYIVELENEGENWGLPKEGQANNGYGKLLWVGGSGTSGGQVVEGPFVFYNAATDYYYLMATYGELNYSYNMRIARSKSPDGPYEDVAGNKMASQYSDAFGNKVAGNFIMGEADGYAAIGHNSVVEKDGEFFVVAHVRRRSKNDNYGVTPGHNLYVYQLFFNEDGWPVMSPNRYAGEKAGTGITAALAAGTYDVVEHTLGTPVIAKEDAQTNKNPDYVTSVSYTFAEDGTVTGAGGEVGKWTLSGDYYVTVVLDGTTYKGVIVPGWNIYVSIPYTTESNAHSCFAITALSAEGRSLWAVGTTAPAQS